MRTIPGCPLTAALNAIGGKWKLAIIWYLRERPRHFGELSRLLPGISQKVLTQALRNLERDGLVERAVEPRVPTTVRYSLTPYGRTVEPLLDAVRNWGAQHLEYFSELTARRPGSDP